MSPLYSSEGPCLHREAPIPSQGPALSAHMRWVPWGISELEEVGLPALILPRQLCTTNSNSGHPCAERHRMSHLICSISFNPHDNRTTAGSIITVLVLELWIQAQRGSVTHPQSHS